MMTDYESYKHWVSYTLKDYYVSEHTMKLKPLILPSYDEWKIEVAQIKREQKINDIINGE